MLINVFVNVSNNSEKRSDTSLFVQKPFLRTKFIESKIEEDINSKNQNRIKNLPGPISIGEAASEKYLDNKRNKDFDFKNEEIENMKFVQVNYQPAVNQHLTPKNYVDNAIDESTLVRNNQDNNFKFYNLTNVKSITLTTQALSDNQVIIRAYVDQFHQENDQPRRDLG